jgi:hypothetical protein
VIFWYKDIFFDFWETFLFAPFGLFVASLNVWQFLIFSVYFYILKFILMFLLNLYVWQFLIFSVYFWNLPPCSCSNGFVVVLFFELFAFWYFWGTV